MKVLATYNIKGGVGKTAAAVNLAYLAARDGAPTLLFDLDPQAAATFYLRVKPKVKGGGRRLIRRKKKIGPLIRGTDCEGLDLLPADFSYRHLDLFLTKTKNPARQLRRVLKPLRKEYEFLFLDCPPSISMASESVFGAADALLVPTIPTTLSLKALEQLTRHLRKRGPARLAVLPFLSMVDRRKSLHRELAERCRRDHPGFLETAIPTSSRVEQMGIRRAPLPVFAGWSRAARAYEALWEEIRTRLDLGSAAE